MPIDKAANPGIDFRGFGKPGYCKLCSLADGDVQMGFDKRTREGWTRRQASDWLQRQIPGFPVVGPDMYARHKKHVLTPRDRLVNSVQRAEQRAMAVLPQSTPEEFQTAVMQAGMSKVVTDPESVTIEHALKAAAQLQAGRGGKNTALTIYLGLAMGRSSAQIVEGHAVEVP